MKKLLLVMLSGLGLSLPAATEEPELSFTYREVANQAQSGEYGWHDTTGAIMFAGSQMGFVGAGSFAQIANASILKYWAEENSQKVILATDANGYYTLNVNSGLLSATSTKKLTRGFHRFTMLVRRGVKGGGDQIAQVLVHVDGEEVFNLGDGAKAFATGPFRLATFGGTAGNLVSGAMWTQAASCGNAESDAEVMAELDQDAAAKYALFEVPVPEPSYAMPERGEMIEESVPSGANKHVINIGAGDWATEVDFTFSNFAARSTTAYPALVTMTGDDMSLSLSANCNNNCELFLTGSNLTATYAYPVPAIIRNNGDVGSNVALAPPANGKVTFRLENRSGELRVYRNGKIILVTDKNLPSGGSINRIEFGPKLSELGGGTVDKVFFYAKNPARVGSNRLVWSDEFEGSEVNEANWTRVPTISNPPNWRQYTSQREDLVTVENGAIVLKGIKNDGSDPSETRKYLCGQVWGLNRISFKKGVYEIRAKFDDQDGAWPALWMLPDNNDWPLTGEIDIVERLNSDTNVYQTVHHGPRVNGWDSTSDGSNKNEIDNGTWNVFRVEWTDAAIKWYVNGKLTFTYAPTNKNSDNWPFTTPFYFILSQQLEGKWVGTVDDESTLPVNMYVDYVRVYQDGDWRRFTTTTTANPTWHTTATGGVWKDGYYTVGSAPIDFTVTGEADYTTINMIAELPPEGSGALVGWKVGGNIVQLVYNRQTNRFDITYNGTTSHAKTVTYEPMDVTKTHVYTIAITAASNGTFVYQDGRLIVSAPDVKWADKKIGLKYTFGSALQAANYDTQVFYGMKIYAADLNYKAASNSQDRVLPTTVTINGRALSSDEIRSAVRLFGPVVEDVNLAVALFDPETGTIEIELNAPFVNGSVSVLGASSLTGPWTRVATVYQPTESVIQIEKERMLGSNFFKVVIEEGRQALGPVEILELANLPSKDFPDTVIYHASGEQYRIPSIVKGGDIAIAAYDMRPYAGDLGTTSTSVSYSPIDIAGNYSTDGGKTWSAPEILVDVQNCYDFTTGVKNNSRDWASRLSDLGDVCMVYDEEAEKFFMMGITGGGLSARKEDKLDSWDTALYTRGNGVNDSWEEWTGGPAGHPRSVRDELLACLAAKGVNTSFTGNQAILAGPGHGLQTKISNPGRLVIPMQYFGPDGTRVFAAYSDDNGNTWKTTKLVPAGQNSQENSQENSIAELDDGSWYMIAKNGKGDWSTQGRHLYHTTDFENWTYLGMFTPSSKVQGSIFKIGNRASDGKGVYAMAFCTSLGSDIGSTRHKLYLYFGVDNHEDAAEPILWDKENYIPLVEGATGSKGYNSMIMIDESTLGVLYEANSHIYFRRIDVGDYL